MSWLLAFFRRPEDRVSDTWLAAQAQRDQRAGDTVFVGPCWSWPVKKLLDSSPIWNKAKLQVRR